MTPSPLYVALYHHGLPFYSLGICMSDRLILAARCDPWSRLCPDCNLDGSGHCHLPQLLLRLVYFSVKSLDNQNWSCIAQPFLFMSQTGLFESQFTHSVSILFLTPPPPASHCPARACHFYSFGIRIAAKIILATRRAPLLRPQSFRLASVSGHCPHP